MKGLILASASPRRRELLASLGVPFEVAVSRFEERAEGLTPAQQALAFARGKAAEVFSRFPDRLVLGADTVVALEGRAFGKPADEEEAKRFLRLLSGRTHEVITGICLMGCGSPQEVCVTTRVTFRVLGEELIGRYVASGLPLDKAGAYGIQDGYPLAERCEGSYSNVVGLPLDETRALLERARKGEIC